MNIGREKKVSLFIIGIFALVSFFSVPSTVRAEDTLSLSITPPLYKVSLDPGNFWSSYLRVMNNGNNEIEVYVKPKNFRGTKAGTLQFVDDRNEIQRGLADWIIVTEESIRIPAGESVRIPFSINLPAETGPGGYYAGLLVGTTPPKAEAKGASATVASALTALVFLRVSGDINESGKIAQFSTDQERYYELAVNFDLIFRNEGNVHLQPKGLIQIYNWRDKEVAKLDVNNASEFGNVLPDSEREWKLEWRGEDSILNFGKYRADLALSFGDEAKQTDVRSVYFWYLDYAVLAKIFGPIIAIIIIIILIIRFYIRRSIISLQRQARISIPRKTDKKLIKSRKLNSSHIINLKK